MKAKTYADNIRAAASSIRRRVPGFHPEIGLILGSGLARAVPTLERSRTILYKDIPGFARATVPGHEGRLILGRAGGKNVAVLQGRVHYYEGHDMAAIALPVRVLKSLGLRTLVVTAAVGALKPAIKPGHLTVVRDHINLMGANPLRAVHEKEFGAMFPDMTGAYDARLREIILSICRRRKIPAREGIYVAVGGPSYETPAEIVAFRKLGGDVVGMSVVPEVLPARQMGVTTAAVVWTSNMAAGLPGAVLDHAEVLALGEQVSGDLRAVLVDRLEDSHRA